MLLFKPRFHGDLWQRVQGVWATLQRVMTGTTTGFVRISKMSNCMALAAAWAPSDSNTRCAGSDVLRMCWVDECGKAKCHKLRKLPETHHLDLKFIQLMYGDGLLLGLPHCRKYIASFEIRDRERSCARKVALTLLSAKPTVLVRVDHVWKQCETHHVLSWGNIQSLPLCNHQDMLNFKGTVNGEWIRVLGTTCMVESETTIQYGCCDQMVSIWGTGSIMLNLWKGCIGCIGVPTSQLPSFRHVSRCGYGIYIRLYKSLDALLSCIYRQLHKNRKVI